LSKEVPREVLLGVARSLARVLVAQVLEELRAPGRGGHE
jgi:hypothetical protein